jgi:hypothetical protein
MEAMLTSALELEGKAPFEWLRERKRGRYQEGQLRTFQHEAGRWRALHYQQVAVPERGHHPGRAMLTV